MNGMPLFSRKDWKVLRQRIEPLGESGLIVRVTVIHRRRRPERWALATEVLRRDDGAEELVSVGAATWLMLPTPEPEPADASAWNRMVEEVFDQAVERIKGTR